jgi:hypothetical protein
MSLSFFALSIAGPALEGLVVWRLLKSRAARRYPYFTTYVIADAISNALLIAAAALREPWFGPAYWVAEAVSVLAGFMILWEVVRGLFPSESALRRVAQSILLGIGIFAIPAIWVLGWSQANLIRFPYRYLSPIFVQYLCLAQAVLLLGTAAVAAYYKLPLGRNLRGLVFGFGFYLSLCAMNFASLQIIRGFLPYWQLVSPVLYIGLLVFWLWAFWDYSPARATDRADLKQPYGKEQWNQMWTDAIGAMRRRPN